MTLREYYEYNVRNKIKRRREEYNYREYKPGYTIKMGGRRHYDFAARMRLRYLSICGQLQGISRPLTMAEWNANMARLIDSAENAREIPGSIRHMNGDLEIYNDDGWRIIG
jgi:hypothetical protein